MQVMRDQDHRRVDTAQQVAVQKVSCQLYKYFVPSSKLQHISGGSVNMWLPTK
jgi:hypothetical protein